MFEFFKKSISSKNIKNISNEKLLRDEFKINFFKDNNHQWLNQDHAIKRSVEILLDSLNEKQLIFFKKHPTFIIPCQAHLSCAVGRTQNHHLILVFPELIKLLKSASAFHGMAILAHELGHIYHQHTEQKIDTLTAQLEADEFAYHLGFGEELQEILLDHDHSVDCKIRIAKLTAQLISHKK